MPFGDCIDEAVKANKLSQVTADNIKQLADQLADVYTQQGVLSQAEIASRSQEVALKNYLSQAKFNRFRESIKTVALTKAYDVVENHPDGAKHGLASLLVKTFKGSKFNINPPVESQAAFLENQYMSLMPDFMNHFNATLTGTYANPADQELFVRALFGEDIKNDTVQGIAENWRDVSKVIFKTARSSGMDLPYLDTWMLPQRWDPETLLKLHTDPEEAAKIFAEKVTPLLDRTKYTDINGNPMTAEGVKNLFETEIFPNIVTQGDSKQTARLESIIGKTKKGTRTIEKPKTETAAIRQFKKRVFGKRRGRLTSSRIVHFKNADGWLQANKEFAGQSPVQSIYSYLKSMSTETALSRTFGHDYEDSFNLLESFANERAVLKGQKATPSSSPRTLFDYLSGKSMTQKGLQAMQRARFFNNVRKITASAFLAKTTLTAITDFAQMGKEAFVLNASIGKSLGFYFKLMTGNKELRGIANELGIMNSMLIGAVGQRFNELTDVTEKGLPSKVENLTVRLTGLHRHTVSLQTGLGLSMNSRIADDAFSSFDSLPQHVQKTYEMFGLNSSNWDFIKDAVVKSKTAGAFIDPKKITNEGLAADPMLPEKVGGMVLFGRNRAIPHNDALINTFLQGSATRGDIASELVIRNPLQFKHFFIGSIMHAVDEFMNAPRTAGIEGKIAYAVGFGLTGLFLGAVSNQLIDIAQLKDPADMTKPAFWIKASTKGLGGMGILGDVITGASDDQSSKISSLAGGATGLMAAGVWKTINDAIFKPLDTLVTGKRTTNHTLNDIITLAQDFSPVQTFYSQGIVKRLMFDQLRKLADPDANKAFRRQMKRAMDNGTDFWWRPGDVTPTRAPSLQNIGGTQ